MTVAEKVKEFLSYYIRIPPDQIPDDLDIVNDVDWSKLDPDDQFFLIDEFVSEFSVFDPETDFGVYVERNAIHRFWIPFAYIYFRFIKEKPTIHRLTVSRMIEMAKTGRWDL